MQLYSFLNFLPSCLPHLTPTYSGIFEINSKTLAQRWRTLIIMFSVLIWQDSRSYCPALPARVFPGWPCWRGRLTLPCLGQRSSPCPACGLQALFFRLSSVTGRLPSFLPGHSVSLAFLAHWSFRTPSPLVLLGPKWNGRTTERFWGNYSGRCRAAAFKLFSWAQCPQSHRCLSFIL